MTTNDIQRAIDKQARLEAEATPSIWVARPSKEEGCLTVRSEVPPTFGIPQLDEYFKDLKQYVCFVKREANATLIAHLRNQAECTLAVIEAAAILCGQTERPKGMHDNGTSLLGNLKEALAAWANRVNGEESE